MPKIISFFLGVSINGRFKADDDAEDDESGEEGGLLGDLNMMQVVRETDFWLIFIATTIISGAGLSIINNISQVL